MDTEPREVDVQMTGARADRWDLVKDRISAIVTRRVEGDVLWATFVAERGVTRARLDEVRSILDDAGIEVNRFALLGEPVGDWVANARATIDAANADLAH